MNKIAILVLSVALSTTILSGALFLGDSVKLTILTLGKEKIGNSRYIINSVNINKMLPPIYQLEDYTDVHFVPILKLPARSLINDSGLSLEHFNAYAVDEAYFNNYHENYEISKVNKGEAVINEYLADQLNIIVGDNVQFRCGYFSNLSPSFSFYGDTQEIFVKRVKISKIIPNRGSGRFSTTVNQGIEPLILFNLCEFQEKLAVLKKVNLYLAGGKTSLDNLHEIINSAFCLSDFGFNIKEFSNQWKLLLSEQLFITPGMLSNIKDAVPECYTVFSYFINSAEYSSKTSPFHFIVGLDRKFLIDQYNLTLADNQAVINEWIVEDLNIKDKAEFILDYFITTNNQKLVNSTNTLIVKDIKPISFFTSFKGLIPDFPGLSGKATCNEWDPSIPINLDKVRDKDEEYWNDWGFTPKILITYSKAKDLWSTEQAVATGILIPSTVNFNQLDKKLTKTLTQSEKGYFIEDYIDRVSTSGNNSINFAELFIGLSFLLIVATVCLLIFIVQIFYTARKDEIFILKATGFSRKKIVRIYLIEILFFTFPGIIMGVCLGLVYNYFLMNGLTTIWYEAARLDTVVMYFSVKNILIGAISSLAINIFAAFCVINKIIRKIVTPTKPKKAKSKNGQIKYSILSASILILLLLSLAILYYYKIVDSSVAVFFIAGGLLLLLFPVLAIIFIKLAIIKRQKSFSIKHFILGSINYNLSRTVSIILITSLSVFMIVSIGGNKLITNTTNSQVGTGRYEISINTAQAISPQQDNYSESWQIPDSKILPIRIKEGDEASCLNLNQVRNPRIAGVDSKILSSELRFKIVEEVQKGAGWEILDSQLPNRNIPAISDKGVLKWSMGLRTGDSLDIKAEDGQIYSLVFMSALSSSIFQGSVLISEENFLKLFPSSKGYNRFLIDLPDSENSQDSVKILKRILRSYGPVVRNSIDILDEYYSVQNSYISIFFQLGLMAVIFAVAGISILLLKKIQEERNEISIQRVIGFRKRMVFKQLFAENFITILYGIFAGVVSSIIALLPIFKEETSLLFEYPLSAFIIISACTIILLSIFITMGLKAFNKMMPESR